MGQGDGTGVQDFSQSLTSLCPKKHSATFAWVECCRIAEGNHPVRLGVSKHTRENRPVRLGVDRRTGLEVLVI